VLLPAAADPAPAALTATLLSSAQPTTWAVDATELPAGAVGVGLQRVNELGEAAGDASDRAELRRPTQACGTARP
jgi:hypothetical protein